METPHISTVNKPPLSATAKRLRRRAGGHGWQAPATPPAAQIERIGSGAVARGAYLRAAGSILEPRTPKKDRSSNWNSWKYPGTTKKDRSSIYIPPLKIWWRTTCWCFLLKVTRAARWWPPCSVRWFITPIDDWYIWPKQRQKTCLTSLCLSHIWMNENDVVTRIMFKIEGIIAKWPTIWGFFWG